MNKLYRVKLNGSYELLYIIAIDFGEAEDKIKKHYQDIPIRDINSIELISTKVII